MSNLGRDRPRMSREDIHTIDNALDNLREAVNLPPHDPQSQNAAVSLRQVGFTPGQIVTLSRRNLPRQSVERWVAEAAAPRRGTSGKSG